MIFLKSGTRCLHLQKDAEILINYQGHLGLEEAVEIFKLEAGNDDYNLIASINLQKDSQEQLNISSQ